MRTFRLGLDESVVRDISAIKNEPKWMLDIRLDAYRKFRELPMPSFGPDLSEIDFDKICFYNQSTDVVVSRWEQVPDDIKQTYEQIGLPEAEQKYLAGAQAQDNSTAVYQRLKDEWQEQGVIYVDTDTAVQKYPELVRKYFGSVVRTNNNKFSALNTAVWSGGSFVYAPPHTRVSVPLQTYFRINISNLGQFERTLIILDEGAELQYVEACTAPIFTADPLHAGVVEVVAKKDARIRFTAIQNWSKNVYNLVTQGILLEKGAIGELISGNIGSKLTMKYPSLILNGAGAHGSILSLAIADNGQWQDGGGKAIHLAPNTSSTITAKSIAKNGGTATYRGKIFVDKNASGVKCSTKCDTLLLDNNSVSETFPQAIIERNDADVAHEASVTNVSNEQLFYMASRGITDEEATDLIVSGFVEPIVRELPMEYASELNRLINLSMKGAVG